MIRTNSYDNPVINVHIQDPLTLSQIYYDHLDDHFKHFVCGTLQNQYHAQYLHPTLSLQEKFHRLSFLESCIFDVEDMVHRAALSAPFHNYLGGQALDKFKSAATAVKKSIGKGKQLAEITAKILILERSLRQKISKFMETFTKDASDKPSRLNEDWDEIRLNLQTLIQLKTKQKESIKL